MPQEIAFAAPRAEEMTEVAVGVLGAGITGVVEGAIVKVAPQMGAAAPILTWGTLLGVPLVGVGGALFTRGLLGDLFKGLASGGVAILGYSVPALIAPALEKKRLTPEQLAALAAARDVKLLPAGALAALQRTQAQVKSSLEI